MSSTFSHKLKLIRQKYNLTQEDFAQILGISRSYLSRLESGHTLPTNKLIEHMALKFKIPQSWLLDDTLEDSSIPEDIDFVGISLLCKYNLLQEEYKEFILNQIEQLLEIQSKISNKKESQDHLLK